MKLLIENPAVWVGQNSPSFPQVVLFRHSFRLVDPAPLAELEIFADTRYEVWIDGAWIGRGPARFSRTLQEFDVYKLDPFHTGTHTIAVLVQWAPNIRRSESTVPQLTARILSQSGFRKQILTKTGSDWKARLSDAWQQDSAPVHDWGLIGPTELLDLRRLPMDWRQPGFPDQDWPDAVLLTQSRECAARACSSTAFYRAPGRVPHAPHYFGCRSALAALFHRRNLSPGPESVRAQAPGLLPDGIGDRDGVDILSIHDDRWG